MVLVAMTTDEISALAATSSELPTGLNSAEQRLFLNLRLLYAQYRVGGISPEQGKREKARIIQAFEVDMLHYRANEKCTGVINRLSHLMDERAECETCRRVMRIIDGREKL